MRVVHFDTNDELPIIEAVIQGPRSSRRIRLVFDTGAGNTQIDTGVIEAIGYSAKMAEKLMSVKAATGDSQPGYIVKTRSLFLFGKSFSDLPVGAYDFENFAEYGIDGLLGFDVIKQLHLELVGPEGVLRIF